MQHVVGTTHWREPVLRYVNVSTQNFLVPNVPGRLGRWEKLGRRAGDFRFIEETARMQGDPIFVDEVTVLVRPERNPLKRALVRGGPPALPGSGTPA
jgi:hypothetical protein